MASLGGLPKAMVYAIVSFLLFASLYGVMILTVANTNTTGWDQSLITLYEASPLIFGICAIASLIIAFVGAVLRAAE